MRYKNLLLIFVFSTFFIGFCGDFITTIIWWNRIHPWFSHGIDEAKTVYQCLNSCWILSFLGAILIIFLFVIFLFLKNIYECIINKKIILFVFIFIIDCISIGSIVSGVYGSTFAIRNPSEKGNEEQKCAKYKWKGYLGATIWVYNHKEKYEEYWNFFNKLFNNHSEGYLCRDVGVSTLVFSLIQCCAIVLFIILIIMILIDSIKQKKENPILNDFSEN